MTERYAGEIGAGVQRLRVLRGRQLARQDVRQHGASRPPGYTDNAALAAIDPGSTLVFAMNRRSNMDYVLVAPRRRAVALSDSVGERARIWPLQALIRAMGA